MPKFTLTVNGAQHTVEADADMPLLWVLRDRLQLTGTKYGCGLALCGACTVHIDGRAARSCVTPVSAVKGRAVTTIEGLSPDGSHPVQVAWIEHDVPQCGYCQAGHIMQAADLLNRIQQPTAADIDEAFQSMVCRCGTHVRIKRALLAVGAAKK
jgi:isoquinoline 1-oxidoreductase subunit alpha